MNLYWLIRAYVVIMIVHLLFVPIFLISKVKPAFFKWLNPVKRFFHIKVYLFMFNLSFFYTGLCLMSEI